MNASDHCTLCGWKFPEDYHEWQLVNERGLQFVCYKCWLAATGKEDEVVEPKTTTNHMVAEGSGNRPATIAPATMATIRQPA